MAVLARQVEIEQDEAEGAGAGGVPAEPVEGHLTVGRHLDGLGQLELVGGPDGGPGIERVVLDQEDGHRGRGPGLGGGLPVLDHRHRPSRSAATAPPGPVASSGMSGTVKWNTLPPSAPASTQMSPPWRSTIRWQMANPSPTPS